MIKKKLSKNAKKVDKFLTTYLKSQNQSPLSQPMKYGLISGGKKIRSTIIFDSGRIFNINEKKLINILTICLKKNLKKFPQIRNYKNDKKQIIYKCKKN